MDIKEKILDTSRKLFNKHGSNKITTNHIAKKLSISPGNLYYHFSNKEEIIFQLGEQMIVELYEITNIKLTEIEFSIEELVLIFRKKFQVQNKYSFLFAEIIIIINNDFNFEKRFKQVRIEWLNYFKSVINDLKRIKIIKNINEVEENTLIEVLWMIQNLWGTYSKIEGKRLDRNRINEGILLLMNISTPYLTQIGKVLKNKIYRAIIEDIDEK